MRFDVRRRGTFERYDPSENRRVTDESNSLSMQRQLLPQPICRDLFSIGMPKNDVCIGRLNHGGLTLLNIHPGFMFQSTIDRLAYHDIPIDSYQRLPLKATQQDFDAADHIVAVKANRASTLD